jgi:dihydroxyacid dehydratase/phosphogluconate dehydratase
VLLGGCDKTTPGLVMGAISMGIPAIYVPAGPMLRGNWRGEFLGSGSDVWKYWMEKRVGNITEEQWNEMESGIARSFGTCMVMGTAATMMAIAEALGLTLPGASSIPAADSGHPRMCGAAGRRIVDMVWEDLTPDRILTPAAFDNAIKVHMAMGGSTNAIIHVIAMARRAGIALDMQRFDQCHHPRHCNGAPGRDCARHAALRPDFARDPGARERPAIGKIPDGGFLLRRRIARADDGIEGQARSVRSHGDGKHPGREYRGRRGLPA